MELLVYLVLGYLLGSLSPSYAIARLVRGIDIRTVGSGRAGGLNTMRQVGRWWGVLAGALDFAKGALAAWLGGRFGGAGVGLVMGLAAVVGHIYPFYLKFRGGRGVATSLGALMVLMPGVATIGMAVLALLYRLTRNIAFSSSIALVTMVPLAWWRQGPLWLSVAPLGVLLLSGLTMLPEMVAMWRGAEDKRDLVLHRWIIDREGRSR
jgi:glycerol-3-phosphate acyltransferase PlsY